jgi:hypothetical protein
VKDLTDAQWLDLFARAAPGDWRNGQPRSREERRRRDGPVRKPITLPCLKFMEKPFEEA